MENATQKRSDAELRDDLDDSWFDRPDRKKVAAELRARISRTYAAANERRASGGGLDDSWFK